MAIPLTPRSPASNPVFIRHDRTGPHLSSKKISIDPAVVEFAHKHDVTVEESSALLAGIEDESARNTPPTPTEGCREVRGKNERRFARDLDRTSHGATNSSRPSAAECRRDFNPPPLRLISRRDREKNPGVCHWCFTELFRAVEAVKIN